MKKIVWLLFALTNAVYATSFAFTFSSFEVVIFNMSDQYDISATYRICTYDFEYNKSCNNETTILINNKKTSDKNYVVITQPKPTIDQIVQLELLSAVEKDSNGTIVAQGKYFDDSKNIHSNCYGHLYTTTQHAGYADTELVLNDMHESPYITCTDRLASHNKTEQSK